MGRKKFIDKKNSATYRLVFKESGGHDESTDRVFVRVDGGDARVPGFDNEDESDVGFGNGNGNGNGCIRPSSSISDDARLELLELGFPDDGYDYLQHLRDVGPSGRIGSFVPINRTRVDPLRPDVKAYDASKVRVTKSMDEDDTSALLVSGSTCRMRGPTTRVLDSDVVALLENEDDQSLVSGDELEDDFVALANEGGEDHSGKQSESEEDDLEEVDGFEVVDALEDNHEEYERPTRFLDEQFELLALREYEDDDIGELDDDDLSMRGNVNLSKFDDVMSDFVISSSAFLDKYQTPGEIQLDKMCNGEKVDEEYFLFRDGVDKKNPQTDFGPDQGATSEDEMELAVVDSDTDEDEGRWDCETIVTTYSNLDNHPGKICSFSGVTSKGTRSSEEHKSLIRLKGKQQLPVDYLPQRSHPKEDGKGKGPAFKHIMTEGSTKSARRRTTEETKEEKKARKTAVKEERRAARASKKDMRVMYKDESQRAQRTAAATGPAVLPL